MSGNWMRGGYLLPSMLMEKPLRATLPAMETVGLQNTSVNGHSNMSMAFRRSLVVYYFQIFELNKEVCFY
uniref:Uncharacterized protein n=1 Tax=Brassica oleracea TaxID=3712 RepID=A0A3P6CPI8_BRAOL|nr:unnamed protein product [Brassica oleracea]